MYIDFNIHIYAIALFFIAAMALVYILVVYLGCQRKVRSCRRRCDSTTDDIIIGLPKASVIVYAHDDAEQLQYTLPALLDQAYLGQYEVIVVNDGGSHQTNMLVKKLKNEHKNLYLTFTPDDSRNVSRKKLAITLGMKAAKGEVVVITDASTLVTSDRWLTKMITPFIDSPIDVVIGYSAPMLTEGHWSGRLSKWFDIAADDVAWLSKAITGKPYRASGNNIAYKRELFFRNNGFRNSLNMSNGDDDIFVNEITSKRNSMVQLSNECISIWGKDGEMKKRMRKYLLSHNFTGRQLSKLTRRIMAFGEWMMWLVVLASVAGALLCGYANIFGWCIAAALIITMLIAVTISWRSTIRIMGGPKLLFTIPLLTFTRPLRNMIRDITSGKAKHANYTWQ